MTPVIALPTVSLPPEMTSMPSFPAAPARRTPLVIAGGVLLLAIAVIVVLMMR
jgi:hypothetical protein